MSKICPKCKQPVDDGLYFCNNCNYAFDANTRLVMELEQWEKDKKTKEAMHQAQQTRSSRYDDDDYVPPKRTQKKKKESSAPMILALLAAVAVGAGIFFFVTR